MPGQCRSKSSSSLPTAPSRTSHIVNSSSTWLLMDSRFRYAIPWKSKKVTRILHLCRFGHNPPASDFLRHAVDLRQNRRTAHSGTVWTHRCNRGLVPVCDRLISMVEAYVKISRTGLICLALLCTCTFVRAQAPQDAATEDQAPAAPQAPAPQPPPAACAQ